MKQLILSNEPNQWFICTKHAISMIALSGWKTNLLGAQIGGKLIKEASYSVIKVLLVSMCIPQSL